MEEKQNLDDLTQEAIEATKRQKSRKRIFGLFVVINIALLAILVYEIVMLATRV